MKPHRQEQKTVQFHFFSQNLEDIIDPSHAMVKLAKQINWAHFEKLFEAARPPTSSQRVPCIPASYIPSDPQRVLFYLSNPSTLSNFNFLSFKI